MDVTKLSEMLTKSSIQKLQELIDLSNTPNEFISDYFGKLKTETNTEVDKISDTSVDRGQIRDAILNELEIYEKKLLAADKKFISNQKAIAAYQAKIDTAFLNMTRKNQQSICIDYTKMITSIESDIYVLKKQLMDNRTFYLFKNQETGLIHLVHIEDCYLSEHEVALLKQTWSYNLNSTSDMNSIFESISEALNNKRIAKFKSFRMASKNLFIVSTLNEYISMILERKSKNVFTINKEIMRMCVNNKLRQAASFKNQIAQEKEKENADKNAAFIINLSECFIDAIENQAFDYLEDIEIFNMQKNKVEIIDAHTLSIMKNLRVLNLAENSIQKVHEYAFADLVNLKSLSLYHNLLKAIPPRTFKGLNQLEELDVSWNSIDVFELNTFQNMRKLVILNLSNNRVKLLNNDLFDDLENLKELRIASNELESVHPNTFKKLFKLELLDLERNAIKTIDPHLFMNMVGLKWLRLACNQIQLIEPGTFDCLTSLERLNLNKNLIKGLDNSVFAKLANLKYLHLNSNQIDSVSHSLLDSLKQLEELYLANNHIGKLDVETFSGLTNVKVLDLRDNLLAQIDIGLFEKLAALEYLDISDNMLQDGQQVKEHFKGKNVRVVTETVERPVVSQACCIS